MITEYIWREAKFSCKDINDFCFKINNFEKEIISVEPCLPIHTDTNQWYQIIYKDYL